MGMGKIYRSVKFNLRWQGIKDAKRAESAKEAKGKGREGGRERERERERRTNVE
jgi:hypothetical protein